MLFNLLILEIYKIKLDRGDTFEISTNRIGKTDIV